MDNGKPQEGNNKIDTEGALAVIIPPGLDPSTNQAAVWCSTMPTTTAGKAQLLKALTGKTPKLSEKINTTIKVADCIFQGVQLLNNETGEIMPCVRTILVLANGELLGCVSQGVHQSLGLIFRLWSRPPWKPPLPLRVIQTETGQGHRFFTLEHAGKTDLDTGGQG